MMHFLKKWKCIKIWWSKFKPTSGTFWISMIHTAQFSSVKSLSHVWLFVTPWTAASQASLSITNSWSLLKLMSVELMKLFIHLSLCHPLLLLPSIFSSIKVFSNELALYIRCPQYWSFSFSINPSSEYSGLTALISLHSKGFLRVFSKTTVQKHQFIDAQKKKLSFVHGPTVTSIPDHWKNHSLD